MLTEHWEKLWKIQKQWKLQHLRWRTSSCWNASKIYAFISVFLSVFGILLVCLLLPIDWRLIGILVAFVPLCICTCCFAVFTGSLQQDNPVWCNFTARRLIHLCSSVAFCCRCNAPLDQELGDLDELLSDLNVQNLAT
jgi:hypothetical protein